jgi:UDP:flavonoid glycosyltransferase YjiC (YdhE family)
VLLNQLRLLLSPRLRQFRISRLFEKTTGEFLGMMWNTADRILIPDLPPPYTISADNIWDIDAAGKLEYVGFTAPKPQINREQVEKVAEDLGFDRSRPIVFFHISGPAETRMPMIRICLEAAKGLKDIQYVFSEGRANGSTEPRKIGSDGRYYEWCPVRDEVFAMSDLIVLRGGHTALSQAIQFGKPVVTIPIENHGEQLGNSVKVASLGLGVMVHPKKIRPEQITRGVEEALSNPEYRRKTEQVRKMTDELNGIDNVVKIIRSYL